MRPGADAAFLLALVHTLFEEELVSLGAAESLVADLEAVRAIAKEFSPEAVASHCAIPATQIRRIARVAKLSGAPEAKAAGVELHVRIGDAVAVGDPLYTVHAETPGELDYALEYAAANRDVVYIGEG